MNKWLSQFLEKPDISDKFDSSVNMSGLSGCPQGLLKENLGNMPETGPDISDRFDSIVNMSGLSGCPQGLLKQNSRNMSKTGPDISDRFGSNVNMLDLSNHSSGTSHEDSLGYDFEERLAIAEHDGQQIEMKAQRVAYLDTFITILSNLAKNDPHKDWLAQKIQITLATLEAQRFLTSN